LIPSQKGRRERARVTKIVQFKPVFLPIALALTFSLNLAFSIVHSIFGIALLLAVDEINDMARTTVNVIGNGLASVVVAKWEGVFGTEAALEENL